MTPGRQILFAGLVLALTTASPAAAQRPYHPVTVASADDALVHNDRPETPPASKTDVRSPVLDSIPGIVPIRPRYWLTGEVLAGTIRGPASPVLLSTLPTANQSAVPLFGGDRLLSDLRGGLSGRAGLWLDCEQSIGIEVGGFLLWEQNDGAGAGNNPSSGVGRPFIDAVTGQPRQELVFLPGVVNGRSDSAASSDHFCGYDFAVRCLLRGWCGSRVDGLVGYRGLSYGDRIQVREDLRPLQPPFAAGTRIRIVDSFETDNRFDGLNFGLAGHFEFDHWFLDARPSIAIGQTTRTVDINGATRVDAPGVPTTVSPGGLLALTSNIGHYQSREWSVVPEATIRLGYMPTESVRIWCGYSALCWPGVLSATQQIDPVVNPGLLPPPLVPLTGPLRPAFPNQSSILWIQMVSVGIELRY